MDHPFRKYVCQQFQSLSLPFQQRLIVSAHVSNSRFTFCLIFITHKANLSAESSLGRQNLGLAATRTFVTYSTLASLADVTYTVALTSTTGYTRHNQLFIFRSKTTFREIRYALSEFQNTHPFLRLLVGIFNVRILQHRRSRVSTCADIIGCF